MAGFTKQQIDILEGFLDQALNTIFEQLQNGFLPASPPSLRSSAPPSAPLSTSPIAHPPAPQPCAQPELPPLPPTNPPSPSVEIPEEVEYKQTPLRNVEQLVFGDCITCPPKFGGTNMRFSRDEEPDAWYTTMLNHKHKLAIGALPIPA